MLAFLNGYSSEWIYVVLFGLLLLCGIGFPMAEELVLLAGGVLVASGTLHPLLMGLVTVFGVLSGDIILFLLGRGVGAKLGSSARLLRRLPPHKLAKGREFFSKYGNMTVFIARFVSGLRAPAFFLAGALAMPFWRFTLIDTLASLVFVPSLCYLGYLFADQFEAMAVWIVHMERRFLLVLIVVVSLGGTIWWYWNKRENRDQTRVLDPP